MITQTLYASFSETEQAERAIGALLDHGVAAEDVSLVIHPNEFSEPGQDGFQTAEAIRKHGTSGITTTTSADAASGAEVGAGIGFGLGVLAAAAAVFVPGAGLVLGGGALATALGGAAGTTAAGAVAGGLTGYLKDQGVPDETIHRYRSTLENRGAVVAVHHPSNGVDGSKIEAILAKYDGTEIGAYPGSRTGATSTWA